MINKDRIVPITAIDRLSLIGEVMMFCDISPEVIAAETIDGDFKIPNSAEKTTFLCNQPAKKIDFTTGVQQGNIQAYFIPGYNFEGFSVDGTDVEYGSTSGRPIEVIPDGVSLYRAMFVNGQVMLFLYTPAAPEQ